jgi:NAD(P)-dependent dehydrogenase (short-subunit alcohol dehydrogenase family)
MESARVVLVTNVGQGFGRAVALAYGQAGFDVVCADPDVDLASKTAAEVEELGAQAIPVQADAAAQLDVRAAFIKVAELFGALGGVVHVACQQSHTPFSRLTDGEFAELLREDLSSTFLILREASRPPGPAWVVVVAPPRALERPQMAAVHGALTHMAAAYSSSSAELVPLEGPEFAELARRDGRSASRPRVNVVVPSRAPSDPRHDARLAHAVRYLGSSASRGVSGTTLVVDLPPPPRIVETLLPEVQAALDDSVRQDDREEDRDGVVEALGAFDGGFVIGKAFDVDGDGVDGELDEPFELADEEFDEGDYDLYDDADVALDDVEGRGDVEARLRRPATR